MQQQNLMQRAVAGALRLRIVRAYLLYGEHHGGRLADSITYRALFSVFAGVLLGVSIAAVVLAGNPELLTALLDALGSVLPGITDLVEPERVRISAGFTVAGALSLLALVAAAISVVGSLRTALRTLADRTFDDAFVLWVIGRNLLVAVAFGGLLLVAAGVSIAASFGIDTVAGWVGISHTGLVAGALSRLVGLVVVFGIDAAAIALVFRLLSGLRVAPGQLWRGAMLGGVGMVVLQELSGLFVRGATANPLLASFSSLIALLIWINLSSQVILLASAYIVTAHAEARDRVHERYGAQTLAQRRRVRAEAKLSAATAELRAAQAAEDAERGAAR